MDQDYNFALPTELNGTVNIPGAGARNIAPGTNSQRQNYDYTRTAIADQQATTESGTHVVEVPISSIAAGRDENYSEVDQVNTVTVVKQQVSDSGSQV